MNGCGLWTQAEVNAQKDEPNERIMSFCYHKPYFRSEHPNKAVTPALKGDSVTTSGTTL